MARVKFKDKDLGWKRVQREIKKAQLKPHVAVGIMGAEAAKDHGGVPNIKVATAHEFGLTIDHPGGTAFVPGADGRVRFVSNAAAEGRNLPRTKPHKIRIPERSFIRGTIDVKKKAIAVFARNLMAGVLSGKTDTKKALGQLGLFIQGQIRQRMSQGIKPPLKPATIARKKSSKPLINTGQLKGSIDYQVRRI